MESAVTSMSDIWEYTATTLCIVLLVFTSLLHSVLGEKRLIGPLLAQRDGILASDMARFLLRSVWHFMTILFWIIAFCLWAGLHAPGMMQMACLGGTALGIGGASVYDAIGSRGRHIGWPFLLGIGLSATLAALARAFTG